MRASRLVPLLLVGACTDAGDDVPSTDTDPSVDTPGDSDPTAHTDEAPPETDAPDESDTPLPDTDAVPVDTDTPPLAWGAGFVDLSAPFHGPGALTVSSGVIGSVEPQPTGIAVGDVDGDGRPEVFVSVGRHMGGTAAYREQVYRYQDGELVPAPDVAPSPFTTGPVSGLVDVDGDGHLDLLGGDHRELVAFGAGDGTWSAPLGIEDGGAHVATFGTVALVDVDEDGWIDLLIGDAWCTWGVVQAQRTGPRTWRPLPELTLDDAPVASAGGVLVMPIAGNRRLVYSVGTACDTARPHPGFYLLEHGVDDRTRLVPTSFDPPDISWVHTPAGGHIRTNSLLMPMGAHATDMDGDGLFDLLLSLSTPWAVSWRQLPDGTFTDRSFTDAMYYPSFQGVPMLPWGLVAPDFDQDGRPDVLVTNGDDATSWMIARGKPIHALAWRDAGGRFERVEAALGLDTIGSFHAAVLTDLDGDGDPDLALGGYGNLPRLYRNDVALGNAIGLRLRGTTSNHLAVGAVVEVHGDAVGRRTLLVGDVAQHWGLPEPQLFAGLGPDTVARLVLVRWPSGYVQELRDLPAGQLHDVVEPRTVRVLPESRSRPADGTSTVTVEVTPRTPAGLLDPAAQVTLQVTNASLVGAPSWTGDRWVATIRAPRTAGTSRVTVRIDGKALTVRPRIWWHAAP